MEKLIVDADGKITIPPRVLEKKGLKPGDELSLVEASEGLLIYRNEVKSENMPNASRVERAGVRRTDSVVAAQRGRRIKLDEIDAHRIAESPE